MRRLFLILTLATTACQLPAPAFRPETSPQDCRGTYYERDGFGVLKKFYQYPHDGKCFTEPRPLSNWETSLERPKTDCVPQPQFASRSLASANNFYSYRDGKVYLDLNAETGTYRKLTLGEDKKGKATFTRLQGCFYQRTGTGVDVSFGNQLLLDTDMASLASSEHFDPMEIFRYDETPTTLSMTRFDSTEDWDYKFCPYLDTPWSFCTLLRNGNIMFWPTLAPADQTALKNEALLIRTQFNYDAVPLSTFESKWTSVPAQRVESGRDNWKYAVVHIVDTPRYKDEAWRDYLMGNRPTMPDVTSPSIPPVCYHGSQTVTLANGGQGKVYGEICYENGVYTFTQ